MAASAAATTTTARVTEVNLETIIAANHRIKKLMNKAHSIAHHMIQLSTLVLMIWSVREVRSGHQCHPDQWPRGPFRTICGQICLYSKETLGSVSASLRDGIHLPRDRTLCGSLHVCILYGSLPGAPPYGWHRGDDRGHTSDGRDCDKCALHRIASASAVPGNNLLQDAFPVWRVCGTGIRAKKGLMNFVS